MYLLDTNVISELRQGKPGQSDAVRRWAAQQPIAQLYLSAITVLELEIGVRRIERKDAAQGEVLRRWCEAVRHQFAGRVVPLGETTALRCAALHVPDPQAWRDSMIAATALEHGYTVATRNTGDFAGTGAQLIDPWKQ
ncbi:MAG: twitching motility protein PilT [Methylibium sp. NZG]|nr:MAG: twitching motility protein PilT [Methylibium sp. NZG]